MGTVFPDPRLVTATVDRVTCNAHILETGTQPYRLRTSKTSTRGKRAADVATAESGAAADTLPRLLVLRLAKNAATTHLLNRDTAAQRQEAPQRAAGSADAAVADVGGQR